MRLSDLKIATRLHLGFGAVVALLIALVSMAYTNFARLGSANDMNVHTYQVLGGIKGEEAGLTAQRGESVLDLEAGMSRTLIGGGIGAAVLAIALAIWLGRNITAPLRYAVRVARRVANGDLTSRVQVRSKDETGELMAALKEMTESLLDIVTRVRAGTETIATASGEINSGNQDLSARTEQQAGSLEDTASSMDELTSTRTPHADHARQ